MSRIVGETKGVDPGCGTAGGAGGHAEAQRDPRGGVGGPHPVVHEGARVARGGLHGRALGPQGRLGRGGLRGHAGLKPGVEGLGWAQRLAEPGWLAWAGGWRANSI